MRGMWRKRFSTLLLGLMLTAPIAGCVARPAPRPAPVSPTGFDPALSAAVAQSASQVTGAGKVAAVVRGNQAVIATQLDTASPGGTNGGSLTGRTNDPDTAGTSPGGGPEYIHGPGGSHGVSPGMPGGGIHPGGATPGGSPSSTQAIPDASGNPASSGGTTTTPAPTPGSIHSAPMDVFIRIANKVKADHPTIADVRFVTDPADARRLAEMAGAGALSGDMATEFDRLAARAIPAGAVTMPPGNLPENTTKPVR